MRQIFLLIPFLAFMSVTALAQAELSVLSISRSPQLEEAEMISAELKGQMTDVQKLGVGLNEAMKAANSVDKEQLIALRKEVIGSLAGLEQALNGVNGALPELFEAAKADAQQALSGSYAVANKVMSALAPADK